MVSNDEFSAQTDRQKTSHWVHKAYGRTSILTLGRDKCAERDKCARRDKCASTDTPHPWKL